jgi:hypothetical protein
MPSKSTVIETNALVDFIRNYLTTRMTFEDIPNLVVQTMRLAQKMTHLTGIEKRTAVTKAIVMCIDRSDIAGPFEGIILQLVPKLCDAFIKVDKGKLVINKKITKCGCMPF